MRRAVNALALAVYGGSSPPVSTKIAGVTGMAYLARLERVAWWFDSTRRHQFDPGSFNGRTAAFEVAYRSSNL